MKVSLDGDGAARAHQQGASSAADGEYIGVALIGAGGGRAARGRARGDVAPRPVALLRGRLPGARRPRRDGRAAPIGSVDWVEVDDDADLARAREIEWRY